MKFFTKVKSVFFLLVAILCFFGVLFIKNSLTSKTSIIKNSNNKQIQNTNISGSLRDLEECKIQLFTLKHENEKIKLLPDTRKDIISLLFIMHDIEQQLGKKNDFSDECVRLFATASRINTVQEYILQYKDKMFSTICQVATEREILLLIKPFEMKILQYKYEIENSKIDEQNKIKKIWNYIKYNTLKLFKKANIEKSILSDMILNKKYKETLDFIDKVSKDKNMKESEYHELYSSLENIYLLDKIINDLYKMLEDFNK